MPTPPLRMAEVTKRMNSTKTDKTTNFITILTRLSWEAEVVVMPKEVYWADSPECIGLDEVA
eukprot:CAMPEP_0182501150 /NCGR_PEP_ID=MMETSP1321-20130603/10753_1 /TAXON_ID=91990 /ORGANISM="Bolidomonas sp., Strain RCC1657" /LENGTH=61 /DNA_ID=CAMNT_0024705761 /DNA_START=513 /DNA_END=698 /DNA_ORIENTATION=-